MVAGSGRWACFDSVVQCILADCCPVLRLKADWQMAATVRNHWPNRGFHRQLGPGTFPCVILDSLFVRGATSCPERRSSR
jgi:hypothetical protein